MVTVEFYGEMFTVTVAKSCSAVRMWIDEAERSNADGLIRNKLRAGISIQWRRDSPADLLQICVGRKVLIIQLRFFWKIPNPLVRFFNRSHVKLRTTFVHDLRKTLSDHNRQRSFGGASIGRLLRGAAIADEDALRCLEDQSLVTSDWSRCDLRTTQIRHASLRAIVAAQLDRDFDFVRGLGFGSQTFFFFLMDQILWIVK